MVRYTLAAVSLLSALFVVALFCAVRVEGQEEQQSIAQELRTGDLAAQSRAIQLARAIDPQKINPQLRLALIEALDRAGTIVALRTAAVERGDDAERFGNPSDFIFKLIPTVWALRDVRAIPALTKVLEFQPASYEALADLGEMAVPALISSVTSPQSRPGQIQGSLIALRFIVEESNATTLTVNSRNQIRGVASQYLTRKDPNGDGTLLRLSIDLAAALHDPSLLQVIESLVIDSKAVIARGVQEPKEVQRIQRQAADRARGLPSDLRRIGLNRLSNQ